MRGTIGQDIPLAWRSDPNGPNGAALAQERANPRLSFLGVPQNLEPGKLADHNIVNMPLMKKTSTLPQPNVTPLARIRSHNILGNPIYPLGGGS